MWEVNDARHSIKVKHLAFAEPWFIEEPLRPDDVEGHRRIREGIHRSGRHRRGVQNRIMFA